MRVPKTAVLAAPTVACLLLAGCASAGSSAGPPRVKATSVALSSTGVSSGGVFGRVLANPAVTVTGGQLYVAWQVNQPSAKVPRFELARADQATGAIEATRRLVAGYPGTPLAAGGWLWLTISTAAGEQLLRMNPAPLTVAGEISMGAVSYQDLAGRGGDLAVAGGALWAADGNRLLRVSLPAGRVTAAVPLPGAFTSVLSASAGGTVLAVGEADDGGLGSVQRRNPVTGALIASHPMYGVTAPRVGVIGSGTWVAEPTGMLGYIERFSTATMTPDPATEVGGSNGIDVRVAGGLAWVTEGVNPRHDYCADPVTGRVLGRIPLPGPASVLAITGRYVYYQVPAPDETGSYLRRLAVPAGCLAPVRTG